MNWKGKEEFDIQAWFLIVYARARAHTHTHTHTSGTLPRRRMILRGHFCWNSYQKWCTVATLCAYKHRHYFSYMFTFL